MPAPIRWVMGILAVLLLYVLSVGPIDWLHATRRMSDASYQRVDNLIYGPVNELLESPETDDWAVSEAYASYRAWWSDSDEAATPTASSSLTQPNQDHSIHRQVNRNPVPSPDK